MSRRSAFITLFAALAASGALAQGKLQQKQEQQEARQKAQEYKVRPPPQPQYREPPKTCEAQCKMMEDECTAPCKQVKGPPELQKECAADCVQFVSACRGSCKQHGYIDKRYMIERIKPPQPPGRMPAGGAEGAESAGGGEE